MNPKPATAVPDASFLGSLRALIPDVCVRPAHPGAAAAWGTGDTDAGVELVAFATNSDLRGGALTSVTCDEIVAAYDHALAAQVPIVGLWHSSGAHVGEGAASLDGVGRVMATMTRASGRIPQISVVLGHAAGGAAYGPALTDVVILAPEGRVFVTGPDVIRTVTGESVDMVELGGPDVHSRRSGVAHLTAPTAADALTLAAELARLFADQGSIGAVSDLPLGQLLPESRQRAYDVRPLVDSLLDVPGVEFHPRWAPNVVTVLGRLGGRTVGVVANNPIRLAGCLNAAAAEKAARFVRMCDAFGVPLIAVVDVPGYMPGVRQEWDGVVRRGAKLVHAFAEATVPRVTVVTRRAYGGAYIAMNSRSLGSDRVLAWPGAEIAVMGPVAAVRLLNHRRLAALPEPSRQVAEAELVADHERRVGSVSHAMQLGLVDDLIDPDRTRTAVASALQQIPDRRGRHGNIPL